jgi:putative addiction module component (TIGR02574 family)
VFTGKLEPSHRSGYSPLMTASFESVLASALNLPVEERSRMASRLIQSVDDDGDSSLSAAWESEIDRRLDAARSSTVASVSHDEVMAGARSLLRQLKPQGA